MTRERVFPGRNPDVGFLHCGGRALSVNISTHTGFGDDVDVESLRHSLDELARRAPLIVSRLLTFEHRLPGRHHVWVAPAEGAREPVPLDVVDLPAGSGEADTTERCARGANVRIDPRREPPLRVTLLRRAGGRCDLLTTLHHALYDGASVGFVFYALKRLYVAAETGRELARVELPRVTAPGDAEFARSVAGIGRWRRGALTARGWRLLLRERRFRPVDVPAAEPPGGGRSLHRTVFVNLDDPGLAAVRALLARHDATLNELLQAVVARAFFAFGREAGWLDRTLPLATTFNLRRPSLEEYPLGNLETATCVELRREDVEQPARLLDALVRRSRAEKSSLLPLGHYLALGQLSRAPSAWMPRIVREVANRAVLLFSYLGADFASRYLGHFGGAAEEEAARLEALVRGHPGSGAGYVTSAPPEALVVTVKRVARRVAINLSLHDGLTDEPGMDHLARSIQNQLTTYAH